MCVCPVFSVPVVPEQDVERCQRAKLQSSLVFAQEGSEDGHGVGEDGPEVDLQRRAGDQSQS